MVAADVALNGVISIALGRGADLKAGLLTGAKAALLEGKPLAEAIKAAISATLARNPGAAAGLNPAPEVLDRLVKVAVTDAAAQIAATAANAALAGGAGRGGDCQQGHGKGERRNCGTPFP